MRTITESKGYGLVSQTLAGILGVVLRAESRKSLADLEPSPERLDLGGRKKIVPVRTPYWSSWCGCLGIAD